MFKSEKGAVNIYYCWAPYVENCEMGC